MRKLAPAFILTTAVAFASGSAFALGDMNKNKRSAEGEAATQQSAGTSYGTTTPSSANGSTTLGTNAAPSSPQSQYGAAASTNGSAMGNGAAGDNAARNDTRCDPARYANRSELPRDCATAGTGAAATNSTQGQSGASASSGPAGSPGASGSPAGSGSPGSSSGPGSSGSSSGGAGSSGGGSSGGGSQ